MVAHAREGRRSDASNDLLAALRAGAREFSCYVALADALRSSRRVEEAIDEYLRALTCAPPVAERTRVQYELADAHASIGQRELSSYWFQRVSRESPTFEDARGSVTQRLRALIDPGPPADVA